MSESARFSRGPSRASCRSHLHPPVAQTRSSPTIHAHTHMQPNLCFRPCKVALQMVWQGQVPVYWVPQLQLEMLASGTPSVILLSRSATKVCSLQRSFITLSGSDAAAWP